MLSCQALCCISDTNWMQLSGEVRLSHFPWESQLNSAVARTAGKIYFCKPFEGLFWSVDQKEKLQRSHNIKREVA